MASGAKEKEVKSKERIAYKMICFTSSRRKPGWRFTAGSAYQNSIESGQSGTAHANTFDHVIYILDYKTIWNVLMKWHNKFKLYIEALVEANKMTK